MIVLQSFCSRYAGFDFLLSSNYYCPIPDRSNLSLQPQSPKSLARLYNRFSWSYFYNAFVSTSAASLSKHHIHNSPTKQ